MSKDSMIDSICDDIKEQLQTNQLSLPRLPVIMAKINDTLNDDNKSLKDISDIIQYDTSVAARILQVANSPALRGRQEISTIHMALTRLGINMIRNIILSMSFKDTFKANDKDLSDLLEYYWEHNVTIGILGAFLCSKTKLNPDIAIMCGILHDLGNLPIIQYFDDLDNGHHFLDDLEQGEKMELVRSVCMQLHTEMGAEILTEWNFPDEIVEAVRNHHHCNANSDGEVQYADLIAAAEVILRIHGKNAIENTNQLLPDGKMCHKIGIAKTDPEEIMGNISEHLTELKEVLLN